MKYDYLDSFLTNATDPQKLDNIEAKAIDEVNKLNINDEFYFEKLVVSKVYMELCKEQFEDESIQKKYTIYKEEFNRYKTLASQECSHTLQLSRG